MKGADFSFWARGKRWACAWGHFLGARQRGLRRLVGVGAVVGFVVVVGRFWDPVFQLTSFLSVDERAQDRCLPVLRDEPVLFSNGGYDGQYYVQVACDPTLRDPRLARAIDSLPYRARRILMPAVAWVIGGGRAERIVGVFPWLNIGCWLALAWLLWGRLQADGRWAGVFGWAGILFSAGVLASVRCALTDLPALLLFTLAMGAAERGRPGWMAAWFGGALLTRETMLVGAWGLLERAWAKPLVLLRTAGWLALAVLPLGLWLGYVAWIAGAAGAGQRNFAWPGVGLFGDWCEELRFALFSGDHRLGIPSLLATFSLTVQAVFLVLVWRPADRWWRAGFGSLLLMLVLGTAVWEGVFGAALRVVLPMSLACTILALGRRRSLLWLVLMNLSVPAGLVEMTPPLHPPVLDQDRGGAGSVMLGEGRGCYGAECRAADCWVWTAQDAELRLRAWTGPAGARVVVRARARALDERELVVSWEGRELWRGRLGRNWSDVEMPAFQLPAGTHFLQLHSPDPPVREGPNPDARWFSVCLLNPRVEVRDENAASRPSD